MHQAWAGGTKNAMTLKEINSNEEPNAGGRQLHMLLSNETTPCSGHVSTNNQHSKRYKRYLGPLTPCHAGPNGDRLEALGTPRSSLEEAVIGIWQYYGY